MDPGRFERASPASAPCDVANCLALAREAFLGWHMTVQRELALASRELARLEEALQEAIGDRPLARAQQAEPAALAGAQRRDRPPQPTGEAATGPATSAQRLDCVQQRIIHVARLVDRLSVPFGFAAGAAQGDRRAMRAGYEDLATLWPRPAPARARARAEAPGSAGPEPVETSAGAARRRP